MPQEAGVTVTRPQSPLKLSRRRQEPQMLGLELSDSVAWPGSVSHALV